MGKTHGKKEGTAVFVSPYAGLIDAAGKARQNALWDPVEDKHSDRIANLARGEGTIRISARSTITAESCRWKLDGQAKQTAPCKGHAFDVNLSDVAHDNSSRTLTVTSDDGRQSQTTQVKVKHWLIIGLGESYASGQGNPDVSARWATWSASTKPEDLDVTWLNKPKDFLETGTIGARWLDAECYRSFFNYKTLTALKIASDEPHSFVSFLHYACSGAEVFDGPMNPQEIPKDSNRANDFGQRNKPSWYHARSQLHSVILDLCAAPGEVRSYPQDLQDRLVVRSQTGGKHAFLRHNNFTGALEPESGISPRFTRVFGDFGERTYAAHRNSDDWGKKFQDGYPTDGLLDCPGGLATKPDLVLLGIGGNDSGFESIVRYYVAPNTFRLGVANYFAAGGICPRTGNLGDNAVARAACDLKPYDTSALITGDDDNWRCAGRRRWQDAVFGKACWTPPMGMVQYISIHSTRASISTTRCFLRFTVHRTSTQARGVITDQFGRRTRPGHPERLLRPGRSDVKQGPVLRDDIFPVRRIDR